MTTLGVAEADPGAKLAKDIGQRLTEALAAAGVDTSRTGGRAPRGSKTVKDFAEKSGITPGDITKMRQGRSVDTAPTLARWTRLAQLLGVRAEWLFLGELPRARDGDKLRAVDEQVLEVLRAQGDLIADLQRRLEAVSVDHSTTRPAPPKRDTRT